MAPRNTFAATRRSHTILRWLKNGRDVRISDVQEEFDIQYAQARADLKLLEDEYGLNTGRDGRTKVWRWAEFEPHLDVATAASLELGAIALDLFRDTVYGDAIDNLVRYCRRRFSETRQQDLDRLSESLHLRRTWLPNDKSLVDAHLEAALDSLNKHWIAGRYHASDGDCGDYVIFPRKLIWYHGRLWLLGRHEDELKLFDLAGFEEIKVDFGETDTPRSQVRKLLESVGGLQAIDTSDESDEENSESSERLDSEEALESAVDRRWVPNDPERVSEMEMPEEAEPGEYFEDSFGIYAQTYPTDEVHLEVTGAWRSYFERYRMHPSQQTEPSEDGTSLHVRFEVEICPEFRSFVLGMIPDVTVHGPESMREELRARVHEWLGDEETVQPGA